MTIQVIPEIATISKISVGKVVAFSSRLASVQARKGIEMAITYHHPVNMNSSAGENKFSAKNGPLRAVYASIQIIPRGKTTQISVASQPSIRFLPLMVLKGPFWLFFWSQGAKWSVHFFSGVPFWPSCPFWLFFGPIPQGIQCRSENTNFAATQKKQMKMGPTQIDH